MLRRFFKDSILYGGANLFTKLVVVLLVPVYARVFQPLEMGVIDMIFAFGSIASVVVPMGISNGIARFLPDAKDEESRAAHASSAWWFTVGTYGVYALIAVILSRYLASWMLDNEQWSTVFKIAIAAHVCNGLQYFLQGLLRWQLLPKAFIISNFVSMVVMVSVCLVLILVVRTGISGVYYAQIIGTMFGSAIAWYHSRNILRRAFNWSIFKRMLIFSLPLVPALVGEFISNYVDRLAIKKLMTIADVGVYGMGYRFAAVVGLLMAGFSSAITPLVYAHYREEGTPLELARIFRYFLVCAIPLVAGLILFSQELLWVFATPLYYSAWPIIPVLGAAYLLFGMYNFAPGLSIAMRSKAIAMINLLTAVLNTALNFILIPFMGIVGAATATLISAATAFAVYMLLSQKCYPVPHKWKEMWIAVTCGLVIAVSGLMFTGLQGLSLMGITIKSCFLVLCCLSTVTVLVGYHEVRQFFFRLTKKLPAVSP